MFYGSFNNSIDYKESDERGDRADEKIYERVSAEITFFLGRRKGYSAQDAYKYFHIRYGAYPVDICGAINYFNTSCASFEMNERRAGGMEDIPSLDPEKYAFFGGDREMAIVIDAERAGIPSLGARPAVPKGMDNIVIFLSSADGLNVGSMKVVNFEGVEEIEYALEFFRRNSGCGEDILGYICSYFNKIFARSAPAGMLSTSIENADVCIMNIDGVEGQRMTVRFDLSPSPRIILGAFGGEREWELSEYGANCALSAAMDGIERGRLIIAEENGREYARAAWLGEGLASVEDVASYFNDFATLNGIYMPPNSVLKYYSFTGSDKIFVRL